jgi:hypothetical protein
MIKLHIGQKTFEDWKAGVPITKERKQGNAPETPSASPLVMKDRALRPGGQTTVVLGEGVRVIANVDSSGTENARKQKLKRDRATFGDENVLESTTECEGEILKKQRLETSKGTTIIRDLCVDGQ